MSLTKPAPVDSAALLPKTQRLVKRAPVDTKRLKKSLNRLGPKRAQDVYSLIYKYYRDVTGRTDEIPYDGEQTLDGVEFDLGIFPEQLLRLLDEFLKK